MNKYQKFDFIFTQEKQSSTKIYFTTNIVIVYVSIFVSSLQFWHLMYIWKIYPTLYVQFAYILLNNIIMKSSNIYVSINGYLLQEINIHGWKINIQYFRLDHPVFHDINIEINKQEIYMTFMLADGVYINHPLDLISF